LAKFLNTSATNYFLEELIKNASDRLILISPYLKLNDRIKELIEDKDIHGANDAVGAVSFAKASLRQPEPQ